MRDHPRGLPAPAAELLRLYTPRVSAIMPVVGIYIYGSAALGAFAASSDLDFVTVLERTPERRELRTLLHMHRSLSRELDLARRLNGEYPGRADLLADMPCDAIDELRLRHRVVGPFARAQLHEDGYIVMGPPVGDLVPRPARGELIQAAIVELQRDWEPRSDSVLMWCSKRRAESAVASLARLHAFLATAELVSKQDALQRLARHPRWETLATDALAWRAQARDSATQSALARATDVRELVRWTVSEAGRLLEARHPELASAWYGRSRA